MTSVIAALPERQRELGTPDEFNQRVKGTEKFWSEAGAEARLQLRADHPSDDEPLQRFWQDRQGSQSGQRPYRHAA